MTQPSAGLYVELRALVAKFQQDMEGAAKTVIGVERRMSGAFNTINKVAQAALVIGGVAAVYKLSQAVGVLAEKGDTLNDLTENFKKLGGSADQLQAAKDALLGTASSMDLMKIANEGMIKQIPGIRDNFALMADYAGRFAEATGGDAKDALQQLTDAFATGKDKSLAAMGIIVDTSKAYQDFGSKVGIAADQLDETQKKEARQLEGLKQLLEAKKELLPMEDSLNAAQKALGVSVDEATAKFGTALASNQELTKAYREFAEEMDKVDWAALGRAAAEFFATVLGWAQAVLPKVIKWAEDASRGFNYLFGSGTQAEADRTATKIEEITAQLQEFDKAAAKRPKGVTLFGEELFAGSDKERQKIVDSLNEQTEKFNKLRDKLSAHTVEAGKAGVATDKLTVEIKGMGEVQIPAIKHTQLGTQALSQQAKEAEKAAKEIEKFRQKWEETISKNNEDSLKSQIDKAIETLNREKFEELKRRMQKTVKEGFLKEWEEAIKKGAVSFEEVEREGQKMAEAVGAELEDKMTEAGKRAAEETSREFSRAFDSLAGNLAQIGQAFGLDLSGTSKALSQYLSENYKSDTVKGIASAFGYDTSTDASSQAAAQDIAGYGDAFGTLAGYYTGSKKKDKETKSNAGSGGAAGATVGAAVGAYFGGGAGAAIGANAGGEAGQMIGSFIPRGRQESMSIARHAFANYIEEMFSKLAQASFYDAQGKLKNIAGKKFNFMEGSTDRFNPQYYKDQGGQIHQMATWADDFNKMSGKARDTFYGLGEAMRRVLGYTEDIGAQIGYLMAEQFSGNIDNARLLVQQLGLDVNTLTEALVQAGKDGSMSWHEVEVGLQGVAEAFKPGIVAIGDTAGAMEELIGSGGRGVAALKGVRDSAVEAMEAGAHSIEELGQKMIAQGVDPTLVADYMQAIKDRGIKTLEELANASDRVAGGIVADLESNNEAVRKQWEQMTKDLKGLAETIEKIPTEKDIKINVTTDLDDNTNKLLNSDLGGSGGSANSKISKFATGGIVDSPTFFGYGSGKLGVAGEAGAEAILPLTRVGGKLGVLANMGSGNGGGGVSYYVDARGATPGMENRIRSALREVEERAVRRAVNTVADSARRGGRW